MADIYRSTADDDEENNRRVVMLWKGGYVAAASAVCVLAMAADVFNGFRYKKLWFPCKYFSLNATSLTLLTAAMKLLSNLDTNMKWGNYEVLGKLTSLIFMLMAMGNFISSLGSMNNKTILMNSIALGLLVATIVVNIVFLSYIQNAIDPSLVFAWIFTALMLALFAIYITIAITLPRCKRSLESSYQEKCKEVSRGNDGLGIKENMIGEMKKYMVMAETGNPQFVMARSVLSVASSAIFVCIVFFSTIFFIIWFSTEGLGRTICGKTRLSNSCGYKPPLYGSATHVIWNIQFIGVIVGMVAPPMRWFTAVSFNLQFSSPLNFKQVFKVEAHWIQSSVYWRDSISTFQYGHYRKCRKYLHYAKWFALTSCIGLQISIIVFSKLLLFISTLLATPMFLCVKGIKKLWVTKCATNNGHVGREPSDDNEGVNLNRYVLLLEGEKMLPKWVVKSIFRHADRLIQIGSKKQPQNLIELLNKSSNFNDVREFDSSKVQSLHSQEPPNCWTLPIVTLTSIAIALPHNEDLKSMQLVRGVKEGMFLAKLIDKNLDTNARLSNIRNVADVTWGRVAVYRKWQDIDLKRTFSKYRNSKEVLQHLSTIAKETIETFQKKARDPSINDPLNWPTEVIPANSMYGITETMNDPLNWPTEVIAANSMYRITETILLSCQDEGTQTDKELFEHVFDMIVYILAACLTNLESVILRMCRHNAIEERENSVRKAFLLLGRTEQIREILQKHQLPVHDQDKVASIEEYWRTLLSSSLV